MHTTSENREEVNMRMHFEIENETELPEAPEWAWRVYLSVSDANPTWWGWEETYEAARAAVSKYLR